jgi:hypothetical protein
MSEKRRRSSVPIACPACDQKGVAIWEEAALPNPQGLAPKLLSLPVEFVRRDKSHMTNVPEIVCRNCGTVLAD